ncbi:uncharacterized protein LOC143442705 isoform X2 [Arvicanthis niloticus]|uniref:uncharacterized protein LOC143312953 isoform X2 n=1 Tax=Arvicanthis niloticus TaxID=61156 RepID=UPI00402B16F0
MGREFGRKCFLAAPLCLGWKSAGSVGAAISGGGEDLQRGLVARGLHGTGAPLPRGSTFETFQGPFGLDFSSKIHSCTKKKTSEQLSEESSLDILAIFFTSEERSRILTEARKAFLRMGNRPGRWRADGGDCFLSTWRPDRNYRTEEDRMTLSNCHQALLQGMKQAAQKPTDFLMLMCTRQRPKESPSEFLERLLEAYRKYTHIDPDDPVNFEVINQTFVDHSASDIRNAIQRVYGFEDMTRSELLEIAQRVFDSRESEEELIIRTVIKALANSQYSFSRGQRPQRLRRDQCAYCKRLGHWKNECPYRRQVCSSCGDQF